MNAAALFLGLIFLLLFYRWVERRHKVILLKVFGVIAIIGLAILATVYWKHGSAGRLSREIKVKAIRMVDGDSRNTTSIIDETYRHVPDSVWFELCNQSRQTINTVLFVPRTFNRGRSTEHFVKAATETALDAAFFSDVIMKPGACDTLMWSGNSYQILDSVDIKVIAATAEGG